MAPPPYRGAPIERIRMATFDCPECGDNHSFVNEDGEVMNCTTCGWTDVVPTASAVVHEE